METVALRWQIDQGTFPIASVRWPPRTWRQFGYSYWRGDTPGLDYQLFQVCVCGGGSGGGGRGCLAGARLPAVPGRCGGVGGWAGGGGRGGLVWCGSSGICLVAR